MSPPGPRKFLNFLAQPMRRQETVWGPIIVQQSGNGKAHSELASAGGSRLHSELVVVELKLKIEHFIAAAAAVG